MRVDWPVLMRAGLGQLGLRPAEFWALTPAELQMMLGGGERAQPMGRGGLAAMMVAFPDDVVGNGDDR
ncbi:rcc01693 family protein [Roseivivax halodurans]|nr:rcc01693 family protein [Roseivivax halodurans]